MPQEPRAEAHRDACLRLCETTTENKEQGISEKMESQGQIVKSHTMDIPQAPVFEETNEHENKFENKHWINPKVEKLNKPLTQKEVSDQ